MPIDLQDSIVYGPIRSRRFGNSLGINILPLTWKLCDFDCVYCQYGWTPERAGEERIKRIRELAPLMEREMSAFKESGEAVDCITIAGNGEPALHPDFPEIVSRVKKLRDRFYPKARVGILTDAALIHKPRVRQALLELDDRYLKLDVGTPEDLAAINRPAGSKTSSFAAALQSQRTGAGAAGSKTSSFAAALQSQRTGAGAAGKFDWDRFVEALRDFPDKVLQCLFVTGSYDNTDEERIARWIRLVAYVRPKAVQVYTVDRPTADPGIRKVSAERLREIAARLEQETGIEACVFGP